MCNNICRNCKHWGATGGFFSVTKLLTPCGHGGHGWTDRAEAIKYIAESRATEKNAWGCDVLKATVEVEIDQGSGWDAGGASVDEINTPGDFGCNKFVQCDPEA